MFFMKNFALFLTPMLLSVGIAVCEAPQDVTASTQKGSVPESVRPHSLLAEIQALSGSLDKKIRVFMSCGFSDLISHLEKLQRQEAAQGEFINARSCPDTQKYFARIQNDITWLQASSEESLRNVIIEERKVQKKASQHCTNEYEKLWIQAPFAHSIPGDNQQAVENALQEAMKNKQFLQCQDALNDILRAKQLVPYYDKQFKACTKLKERLEKFTNS